MISAPVTGPVLLPADFPVLYDATDAATTAIGSAGATDQAITAASGGLTYDFNGGSGLIYTGDASVSGAATTGDTIFLDGTSPGFVAAGEGHDTVVASSGDNFIALGGGANTAFLDGGSNLVGSRATTRSSLEQPPRPRRAVRRFRSAAVHRCGAVAARCSCSTAAALLTFIRKWMALPAPSPAPARTRCSAAPAAGLTTAARTATILCWPAIRRQRWSVAATAMCCMPSAPRTTCSRRPAPTRS